MVRQAIETPSVVQQVATVLQSYPEGGQIVREALQNASDAESPNFEAWLDMETYSKPKSTSSSSGSSKAKAAPKSKKAADNDAAAEAGLLRKELLDFQGPALVFKNSATFTSEDLLMFSKISQSEKTDRPDKIGRFGRGRLSFFHLGDLIQLVSGRTMLFVEPHEKIFGAEPKADERYDFLDKKENFAAKYPLHCEPFRKFGVDFKGEFSGTVLRIPLRTEQQARTTQLVKNAAAKTVENVRQLLQRFAAEAPRLLYFLPRVRTIVAGVHHPPIGIQTGRAETLAHVHAKREETTPAASESSSKGSGEEGAASSGGEEGAVMQYLAKSPTFELLQTEGKKDRKTPGKLPMEFYTLTITGAFSSEDGTKQALRSARIAVQQKLADGDLLWKLVKNIQAAPLVGVAVSLTDLADGSDSAAASGMGVAGSSSSSSFLTSGQAYTVLPLSISLGLPVSINGIFSLSDNRRELWTSVDLDDADDRDVWNSELQKVAGEIYADVVESLKDRHGHSGTGAGSVPAAGDASAYFRLWPPTAKIDSKWQPVVSAFLSAIRSKPVLPFLGSLQEFREPDGSRLVSLGEDALAQLRTFIRTTPAALQRAKKLALVDVPPFAQKLLREHDSASAGRATSSTSSGATDIRTFGPTEILAQLFLPALEENPDRLDGSADALLLYFLEKVSGVIHCGHGVRWSVTKLEPGTTSQRFAWTLNVRDLDVDVDAEDRLWDIEARAFRRTVKVLEGTFLVEGLSELAADFMAQPKDVHIDQKNNWLPIQLKASEDPDISAWLRQIRHALKTKGASYHGRILVGVNANCSELLAVPVHRLQCWEDVDLRADHWWISEKLLPEALRKHWSEVGTHTHGSLAVLGATSSNALTEARMRKAFIAALGHGGSGYHYEGNPQEFNEVDGYLICRTTGQRLRRQEKTAKIKTRAGQGVVGLTINAGRKNGAGYSAACVDLLLVHVRASVDGFELWGTYAIPVSALADHGYAPTTSADGDPPTDFKKTLNFYPKLGYTSKTIYGWAGGYFFREHELHRMPPKLTLFKPNKPSGMAVTILDTVAAISAGSVAILENAQDKIWGGASKLWSAVKE
eukprot:g6127.t1